MQGVADSLSVEAPALYYIHAPDAVADGIAPERIAESARLACASRAVPLFFARPDGTHLSIEGNPDPVRDWTSQEISVKEPSGIEKRLTAALTVADWAARQARFRHHFTVVSKGHRAGHTMPLSDYLALEPGAREGLEPYIDVRDREGRHAIALVSPSMVGACERARDAWRRLRSSSVERIGEGTRAPARSPAADEAPPPAPSAMIDGRALQVLADNLLRLTGYGKDEPFFKRRLRDFVAHEKGASGEDE
jgi:hypothetical protein